MISPLAKTKKKAQVLCQAQNSVHKLCVRAGNSRPSSQVAISNYNGHHLKPTRKIFFNLSFMLAIDVPKKKKNIYANQSGFVWEICDCKLGMFSLFGFQSFLVMYMHI